MIVNKLERRQRYDCSDNCFYKDKPSACPADIDDKDQYILGPNDHSLMQRLANAGTDHRKFMRMMPVYVRITAPLYWWKEFDTYKVGTVANSCSTMHKIQEKEFDLEDFSTDHLLAYDSELEDYLDECSGTKVYLAAANPGHVMNIIIGTLNYYRIKYLETKDKKYWEQMIQLLPSSYNQTRNVMMNYEVLANIYKSRKNHKLDEWREFCKWIEELPYSELICGSESLKMIEVGRAAADGIQSGIKVYDTAEHGKEHSGWIEEIKNLVNEFEED